VILRRVFYYWQFVAVGALPLWLMVAASIFGTTAWQVLGATFGALAIGFGLLVVSLLFLARREVRVEKAVSWADVGVLGLWQVLIVLMGLYSVTAPWISVLVVLVGLGAFWFAIWELFDAARKRVREAIVYLDETARFGTIPGGPAMFPPTSSQSPSGQSPSGQSPSGQSPSGQSSSRSDQTHPSDRPGTPVDPSVIIVREKPTDR